MRLLLWFVMSQQTSTSTLPPSTPWSILPEELKLQIVRLAATPNTTNRATSTGCPTIPHLNHTLLAINKQTRQLFGTIISKEHLHIRLSGCKCARRTRQSLFTKLSNHFNRRGRVFDVNVCEETLGVNLSLLEVKFMCSEDCVRRSVRLYTFLVTPVAMLTFYAIVQAFLPRFGRMHVESRCYSSVAEALTIEILEEIRKILRNIIIVAGPGLPRGYDLEGLRRDISRRPATSKDFTTIFESHLDMIQDAMDEGTPLEQFISSLFLYENAFDLSSRLVEPGGIWNIHGGRTTYRLYLFRLQLTYDCAVLQAVAHYLLSRQLTVKGQRHFLLDRQTGAWRLACHLFAVDEMVFHFKDLDPDDPAYAGNLDWMAPILKARVEFILAWTQLNTLVEFAIRGDDCDHSPLLAELEYIGDNADGPFRTSTWGSPKSMVLVARRSLKMLRRWIDGAGMRDGAREGVYPVDREVNEVWMEKMTGLADVIDGAQSRRGYDPTLGRRVLEGEMIEGGFGVRFCYLPRGALRREIHDGLVDDEDVGS